MEVPFSSSGAMSRAHYALVRKIESATPQAADHILLAEVQSIRHQLTRSTLTVKQCKECLILLLYCSMSVHPGTSVDLEFALPHAINLAEAGQTIQDKRTGYLFCAEIMRPDHELQLMLVNSIRKDLDSPTVSRICLALDTLIQSPSKDVIPAVQSRLHDLLSHNSANVKRRALLAFDKLSEQDPNILRDIVSPARKRLLDPEPVVVMAALTLSETLLRAELLPKDKFHKVVSGLLASTWSQRPEPSQDLLLVRLIEALENLIPCIHDLQRFLEIIRHYVHMGTPAYAIIRQCFSAAAVCPTEVLLEAQAKTGTSFIQEIRQLLTSQEPNGLYVFVCCLASVEPRLWAGTTPEIPSVLEEWEVERVMKLLDSEDKAIRKQTLRTLWRVDQAIVESYYARALQGELPTISEHGSEELLPRLLEILDITSGNDGESYAHQLKDVLKAIEGEGPLDKRPVLQEAVQEMLLRIHSGDSSWRSGCLGVLFASLVDKDAEVGPTLMVIVTALLCEYLELSPISPDGILRSLASRLSSYSAALQDACLITMLRVSAACDPMPAEIQELVKELHARSGRHVKRRCDQFLALSQAQETLKRILAGTHTSSLPEFVAALERYEADKRRTASRSPKVFPSSPPSNTRSPEPSSSRVSPTPSKLRYAAYDPPRPTHRLRRLSSGSSLHSDDGSARSVSHPRPYEDPLAMTVTPGDLTIAAQTSDLRSIASTSPRSNLSPLPVVQILDEETSVSFRSREESDLITLESPFLSEPAPSIASTLSIAEHDFETTWNSLESSTARGWCEASIDAILRRLQGLQRRLKVTERDRPPFEGDLKIVVCPESPTPLREGLAAIRLKESDDDSCLWWLRCEDEQLSNIIKATLR
ncbi:ARM repeat-containing protein [Pilatotrama ljubarskyi]|nr:ARM repeat-containing protein [Pilatotrama ljubarskyi]